MEKLFQKIEKNPSEEVEKLSNKKLKEVLTLASDYYYNDQEVISDETYDFLENELRKRDPDNDFFKDIGAPIRSNVEKVKLPYYMGSLDKVKPNSKELERWTKKYKGPYFISEKLDGVSGLITTDKIYTRGDGNYGQDISYLKPYLKLPKVPKDMVIRGEFVITKKKFHEKYFPDYPLPRTLVNSIINSKTPDKNIIKDVEFLGYEIVSDNGDIWSEQFSTLKKLGFKSSRGKIFKNIDSKFLSDLFIEWSSEGDYEIDGLVISQNESYVRSTDKNPKYSVAFKIFSESIKTDVIYIDWNASKYGVLFPTVVVNTIKFEGVTVTRASGKNAKFIRDNGIGLGAEILVSYSGGVIPEIVKVVRRTEPFFPKEKYHWNETEVNIVLNEPLKNKEVNIQRLLHMFSVLNIKGISYGMVKKFYYFGLIDIKSIWKTKEKDFLKLPGIKDKMASKLYSSIHEVLDKPINLETIMTMSLVFGNGLAEKKLKLIVETYPNILEDYKDLKLEDITSIEGFSDKLSKVFIDNIEDFVKFLKANNYLKIKEVMAPERKKSVKIKMNVVFSGFRDNELKKQIEDEGGNVVDGVSRKIDWLIVKEITETKTSKVKKAEDLGVKVITKEDFIQKILKC